MIGFFLAICGFVDPSPPRRDPPDLVRLVRRTPQDRAITLKGHRHVRLVERLDQAGILVTLHERAKRTVLEHGVCRRDDDPQRSAWLVYDFDATRVRLARTDATTKQSLPGVRIRPEGHLRVSPSRDVNLLYCRLPLL